MAEDVLGTVSVSGSEARVGRWRYITLQRGRSARRWRAAGASAKGGSIDPRSAAQRAGAPLALARLLSKHSPKILLELNNNYDHDYLNNLPAPALSTYIHYPLNLISKLILPFSAH